MTFITHCLIYYLSGQMPLIRIFDADNNTGEVINDLFEQVSQEKERTFQVGTLRCINLSGQSKLLKFDNDDLLFGSPTATHSLIQLNLIDGYWLFVNPIIHGRGIPLFVDIKAILSSSGKTKHVWS